MNGKTVPAAMLILGLAAAQAFAADKAAYLHYMNGLVQERKGNYDQALQEYKTTIMLDPGSVAVHKQALNLALHVGKVADAEEWAKFVVSADSTTSDNWLMYGNVLWAKGDTIGARTAFERAIELDRENPEPVYQLASLWSSTDPDRSISYLKKYLALKPEDGADVHYQLALLYNVKNDYDAMRDNLLKSKEEDSLYSQPRYMLANYYEVKNDTIAALNEYLELAALEGRNTELLNHIGELYASPAVNDLQEAERYFKKTYELDKGNSVASFWLSVISENRRDFAAAADYLENSKDLKNNPSTILRLSYYYTQSGRYEKAMAMMEEAHKKWPDNVEISYFLALGYDDTKKTAKAAELFRDILAKKPEYNEARMQYAIILERDGDIADAEENFRYLLSKDANNANILNYLGYALADRGLKLAEAEVLISSAVLLDPGNGAFQDSLAWVHFREGKVPEALGEIKAALKLISDDPTVWDHAGDIFASSGDWRAAWRSFNISFMLERPEKRKNQLAKIKNARKQLPDEEAQALTAAFLKAFSPGGKEFSAFAKVYATVRGKQVKLDGIVRFSPPEDFSFTLMGPLMAPLWKIKAGGGTIEMDAPALKDVDENAFNYWASLMASEFRDYLSGDYLDGKALMPDGWGSDCLESPGRRVCLNGDLNLVEKLVPLREEKLQVRLNGYFFKNMYLLPQTIEFKIPFFSVKVVLDKDQINLKDVNTLGL